MLEALFPFGIQRYLVGGLCVGGGIGLLYGSTGLVGGLSSFYSSTWSFVSRHAFFRQPSLTGSRGWRLVYALGLLCGALLYHLTLADQVDAGAAVQLGPLAAGGFLVGFGSRMSKGCTSGHGICGLASLQLPSLLAVVTFMSAAIGVAHLTRILGLP